MRRREFLVSRAKRSSLKPRFNHRVRLLIWLLTRVRPFAQNRLFSTKRWIRTRIKTVKKGIIWPFGTVSHTNLMNLKTDADTISKIKPDLQTVAALLAHNSQYFCELHVASVSTPCYMLLRVVGSCLAKFEVGQTFEPTTLKKNGWREGNYMLTAEFTARPCFALNHLCHKLSFLS